MPSPILVRFYDTVLLKEAERAIERAEAAVTADDSLAHAGGSFTAIVAASSATETYLSEVLAHLEEKRIISASERDEIRQQDGLWTKYNSLAKIFGPGFGKEPIYNTFQALIHLRNCMIHRSAEYLEPGCWPSEVSPYKSVIPHVKGDGLDWTSQVYTLETAQWAVKTTKEFLAKADEYVPDPGRPPFRDPGAVA